MDLSIGDEQRAVCARSPLFSSVFDDEAAVQDSALSIHRFVEHDGRAWSRLLHREHGLTFVEFEPAGSTGALQAHPARLFAAIKAESSLDRLLGKCCEEIRSWTGFDRVMGYVFRPDDSGDVVAESKSERIDSFLQMRFPSSDIPAQARALYVRNTLRFIPDVDYTPSPLVAVGRADAIDLSGSVLRSVSPIHIEYLKNMGVRASMSVSIVVDNRLWGMFACHHNDPLSVPYATREACDMVAHFVSTRVQAIVATNESDRRAEAARFVSRVGGEYMRADDAVRFLVGVEDQLRRHLQCDALVISHRGKIAASGGFPAQAAAAVIQHVSTIDPRSILVARQEWPADVAAQMGDWVGAIVIEFDPAYGGRVVALRREQVSTIQWAGKPEKVEVSGPNGPRLSPRGSFEVWTETVRGQCVPWAAVTLDIRDMVARELSRAAGAVHLELEDARRHLLAMLGHDLRDPLQSIRMAATLLKRTESSNLLGTRIDSSSGRMQRLISQVLDFSRAEAGMPLLGDAQSVDLAAVIHDLVEEAKVAHPGVLFDLELASPSPMLIDASRASQAVSNLLSNARHHTPPGHAIGVKLSVSGGVARITITNESPPIPPETVKVLFDPMKRSERAPMNRSGLGLGLYIAYRIALAMDGDLVYSYGDGRVSFALTLKAEAGSPQ